MSCTDFWEQKHAKKDEYWLTDSKPEEVLRMHAVQTEFKNCRSFLDIGVGFGGMSRYVKSQGKHLISTDISKTALENLKSVSDEVFLIDHVSESAPVDLAVCHLVFQHCNDDTIVEIMNAVRVADDGGILSVQFACLRPGEKANANVRKLINNGTHFLRSLEQFQTLVRERTNKEIVNISKPVDFRRTENLRWYFCKLQNKKE